MMTVPANGLFLIIIFQSTFTKNALAQIFNGKIYAKDNPNSCVVDVESEIEFSIKMAYNDLECNVKRKAQGVYTNEVIIQHHDSIVTRCVH